MFNLPKYKILSEAEHGSSISLDVEIEGDIPPCPKCSGKMVANGKKPISVRDVNIGHQMVGATIIRKRFLCKACGSLLVQKPPFIDETHRMTERLVDYIEKEAANRPFADVANEVGLDKDTIETVFRESADTKIGQIGINTPTQMGIDEVRLGDNTCAVIVNLEKSTLVEILPNRSYETVSAYFSKLDDKWNVQVVAMDAWETYRKAVRATLGCPIVLDRFHAVMGAQNAMEAARKDCRRKLGVSNAILMKSDRTLLLSRPEKLNSSQRAELESMLREFPLLRDGHRLLSEFRVMWESKSRAEAASRLDAWSQSVQGDAARFFRKFKDTTLDWREEILAFFDLGNTNAVTEAINRQIRDMFRAGNGYSPESLRRKVLIRYGQRPVKRTYINFRRYQELNPERFSGANYIDDDLPDFRLQMPGTEDFGHPLGDIAAFQSAETTIDEPRG